jgi:hypothetical protein
MLSLHYKCNFDTYNKLYIKKNIYLLNILGDILFLCTQSVLHISQNKKIENLIEFLHLMGVLVPNLTYSRWNISQTGLQGYYSDEPACKNFACIHSQTYVHRKIDLLLGLISKFTQFLAEDGSKQIKT